MIPDRRATPGQSFAQAYAAALGEYVSGHGEEALTRAYELGRAAASAGTSLLDLALAHHDALQALPPDAGGGPSIALAAQFLAECLSPYEMALRSYQANARLLGLGEQLAQENAAIARAREQLRTILDATTAVIYLKDADGRYLFVNRQFENVFGLRADEVTGRRDEEVLPPEAARTLQSDDRQVLQARAPRELEETLEAPDGPRTYLSLKFPLFDATDVPYGVCCVATDVTERKRAEEAQREARAAAEREEHLQQALIARDQFLAIASHELKTPLTSLGLEAGSLRRLARAQADVRVDDARVQAKCERIVRQVDRLAGLVNNLLDLGRITSGNLDLLREPLDLGDAVRAALAEAREAIEHSGSAVTLRAPAPVVGAWDRRLLHIVVSHLVSNAVKFGQGRPIALDVEARDGVAVLGVRDHGIGISEKDQQRIFGRFERAVSERHYGGFGVGLWLARRIVEAHGGHIHVRSFPDDGTAFTVELPTSG